jgi:hypothetical protein
VEACRSPPSQKVAPVESISEPYDPLASTIRDGAVRTELTDLGDTDTDLLKSTPTAESPQATSPGTSKRVQFRAQPIPDHPPACFVPPPKRPERAPANDRIVYKTEPIQDRVPSCFEVKPKKKPDKSAPVERKERPEKERQMFYDPAETMSSKLRNQRIRQKLAIVPERARIEAEDEGGPPEDGGKEDRTGIEKACGNLRRKVEKGVERQPSRK